MSDDTRDEARDLASGGGGHEAPETAPETARYTVDEERALRESAIADEVPVCPRCQVRMNHRELGGGSFGLGYRRQREWLLCPSCRRSVMYDRKRGTRL